jgi:integrase
MLNELSASAINSYSANLNTLLKTARDEWGVNCHNVSRIKLRIKKPNIRIISPHEDAFIRQWMNSEKAVRGSRSKWNNSDLREIYSILIYTGMRIGELFAFSVNQMEGHKLKLLPEQHKTGDIVGNKVIVLNTEAQFILSMRISRLNLKGSDIVFPFNRKQYSRLWRRMRKEMDIPVTERFTPHCTRHTFASNLIKAGATIYEVSKLLGHASVTTTEMYAHLFTDDLAKVAELLVKSKRR